MEHKRQCIVILEKAESGRNWGAYSPEVPGCYATGVTADATLEKFKSAVEFHLESMRLEGITATNSETLVRTIEIAA